MAVLDTVKNDLSWLQRHERIIIVALVLLVGGWAYGKYADASASKAETRATVAEQALVLQKATNAQNAATTASVLAQYQTMITALSAQNASLATAAASRQAAVVSNQHTDATLALPELANRLKTLGNAPDGTVSVTGNQVNITQPGAVAVTQTLETIPALQADLKDTQALLGATEVAKEQAGKVIAAQTTEITGLNLQIVDADKAHKAEITAVKAEGRKNSVKWFKRGFGLGFLAGLFAGHAAGF